jgi:CHAD domain-containing protein
MEIEAKFTIPDKETCKRLQETDQLAGFLLSTGHSRRVHDFYLDTVELAIKTAGYACRKREQDGTFVIALKEMAEAEGFIHRRKEFEVSLPADLPPEKWPDSPARNLILQFTQQEPLIPLFDLSQTRFVRLMRSHGERLVAELIIDEVHIQAADSERIYYELEVELLAEGTESDLKKIQSCLQHEWSLKPESCSKFERALTLINASTENTSKTKAPVIRLSPTDETGRKLTVVSDHYAFQNSKEKRRAVIATDSAPELNSQSVTPAEQRRPQTSSKKPGLTVNDTMAEAARKTLYFHFKRMVNHEPGTRLGEDIEELHDMRVATRRMRAAIKVFGSYMDVKTIKPSAKKLRRVGRILGAVRDLDVFKLKTQAYLNTLPPHCQDELAPLLSVMDGKHQRAREQMLNLFDSAYYERFKKRFAKFLKRPGTASLPELGSHGELLPQQVRLVLPVVIYQQLANVRAYEELIKSPDLSFVRLHQLRISFKGLRYTLEFFREVLPPDTAQLIGDIRGLQDHLGNVQDAVVTCSILRDFLTWGTWGQEISNREMTHLNPVIAPGVVKYLSARQTELQQLVETFPAAWTRIQQAGFFKKVAAVAHEL